LLGVIRIEMMINRRGLIRWLNGVAYRIKRSGLRTEPWGTPQESGRDWDEWLQALTEKDPVDR